MLRKKVLVRLESNAVLMSEFRSTVACEKNVFRPLHH